MAPKKKKESEAEVDSDLKDALENDNIEEAPDEFISTGSTVLDYMIANRPNGGVPVGRITEIMGENQAGKSLIGVQILANTIKAGGIAICIDTEKDLDKSFGERLGIDWDSSRCIYRYKLEFLEDVFEYIEKVIKKIRLDPKYKERTVTILWDSLAATKPKAEAEDGYDPSKSIGVAARICSKGFRKIRGMIDSERIALVVTNQMREKIGVMFGDNMVPAHGKALSYYASLRIRLNKEQKQMENSKGDAIGSMCHAKIIKSKIAPPFRTATFPLMYDWGVDDESSIHDYLFDLGVITGTAWKKMTFNGEEMLFRSSEWKEKYNTIPGLKEYVKEILNKNLITVFQKAENLDINLDSITEVQQVKDNLEGK